MMLYSCTRMATVGVKGLNDQPIAFISGKAHKKEKEIQVQ